MYMACIYMAIDLYTFKYTSVLCCVCTYVEHC